MKISFLSVLLIFLFYSGANAEVTRTPRDEVISEHACNIDVQNSNFIIRRRPTSSGREKHRGICGGTLRSSGMSNVLALGISGNWVRIGHPNCPNREGWVHQGAFNQSELRALGTGQCASMRNYGYRNPPSAPTPDNSGSVAPRGNNQHRFVLDRCLGIRNDRYGQGAYGASRGGGSRRHNGCDYRAPIGTPLKSPCVGRVTRSGYVGAAGNLIEITCDNGDRFTMMHLQANTRVGHNTRVGIGTQVGKVGNTGNANVRGMIPHVHLEAIIRGRRVDPQSLWSCQ